MFALLVALHLIAAAILILVVLLQSGKAGDLASAFGGATSQAAFGSRGAATLLTKATTVCAVIFMFTSLGLAILYSQDTSATVMEEAAPAAAEETAPAETPPAVPAPAEGGGEEGTGGTNE